jgi:amino acid adenylation domain-containing protein
VTAAELLVSLSARGIALRLDGEELRVRAPRGALTPDDVTLLRARKAELASELRRAGPWGTRLSAQQARLWFLERVEQGLTAYSLPGAFRIEGPLRPELLRAALEDFVARHGLGGVHFTSDAGRPTVVDGVPAPLELRLLEAADLVADARDDGALARWVEAAGDTAVPLDTPPLIRFTLIRRSATEHVLLLVVHHLVWDGWCFDLFLRDVGECYAARLEGRPASLPPLEARYADFVRAQRQALVGPGGEERMRFWSSTLAGPLPDLDLPIDRPRPPVMTYGGARIPLAFDAEMLARVRALAQAEHVTVFTVLLAAYKALLHRVTGQTDLIVAVPVQGRGEPAFEQVVGFFVNTLPVRTQPTPSLAFREYLRQVSARFLAAIDHQDVPFETLVRSFGRRDASRTPIFQTMFTHQHTARRNETWGDVRVRSFNRGTRSVGTDIGLWVREYEDRVDGGLDYRTDLLDEGSARSLARAYARLLDAALRDPDVALSDLSLLDAQDLVAELALHEGPARDVATVESFLERIAAQARTRPQATAAADPSGTCTYAELWQESAAVAAGLGVRGVAAGAPVLVLLERSRRLPAVILGILRAGAVYVPLDASHPPERLRYMVTDSEAKFAIVDSSTESLARALGLQGVPLAMLLGSRGRWEHAVPHGDAAAYRLYTSGSSGRPKAVQVPHRALTNFLDGMHRLLGLAPQDVLLAITTVSFDISLLELLLPLVTGGRVDVASTDETLRAPALIAHLRASGVTVMQATPSTWRLLLDGGWSGGLRLALCGGEALPRSLADQIVTRATQVWNLYGPTETTVWSSAGPVGAGVGTVPLGRPMQNTSIHVLDEQRRVVPQGVRGMIWIGGAGVAQGYWKLAEQTAEAFVPDPFTDRAGARFYRTGDLGRWRADGTLEYLGRVDMQVKVHGHRIELREVQVALESIAGVRTAAVDARGEGADRRLVGWVVFDEGMDVPPTASELRREMRHLLPTYMVPAIILPVAEMPLTPNGKLDYRSLPDPTRAAAAERVGFAAPVGAMEEAIAAEWRRLLGVERVGRFDNFFEIGGFSLLSLQAVAAIEQRTGVRIDPRRFFFSTLAQLAV